MPNDIPVVDISALVSETATNDETKVNVSRAIRDACETVGFLQVVGHGIDKQLIDAMVIEAKRFFSKSPEEKLRYAVQKWNPANKNTYRGYFPSSVNGKEGLDMSLPDRDPNHELVKRGDPLHECNVWPMNEVLTQYWDEMWRISLVLMHAIARSFDLDESFFDPSLDDRPLGGAGTLTTFRFNYYPLNDKQTPVSWGVDDGQPLSCEAHCDGCVLTLLYQHEVGGLQVEMRDRTWLDVPVVPYAFVMNTGRCLERWTNGYLKATNHRVKLLTQERLSVPFFLEASNSAIIAPVPTISGELKYQPVVYGEYITKSNNEFKEYQRDEEKP